MASESKENTNPSLNNVSKPHVNQSFQKARKSTAMQELDRLKFSNPGRQMEELNFNWPEGNVTRSFRKQLVSKHSGHSRNSVPPLYDSRGRLLGTLADTCDCLTPDCPGCHMPCRRCHSNYCGSVCRIYRTFAFQEVKLFI